MKTFKKILIGIDNSKFAEYAAKVGFDMARTFDAEVGLVHIIEPTFVPSPMTDTTLGMPIDSNATLANVEMLDVQNEISDNIIDRTIANYAGDLQVTNLTDYGSTADGILNCSKQFGAELIVIGTHSRTGIDRLLMGSVAEHVIRHAVVPVMVVPYSEVEQGG